VKLLEHRRIHLALVIWPDLVDILWKKWKLKDFTGNYMVRKRRLKWVATLPKLGCGAKERKKRKHGASSLFKVS
jgi:hypothetical protein